MATVEQKIRARVLRLGPAAVFTPKDFLDLGNRGTVDVALSKLAGEGTIRRLKRGLYEFPSTSEKLGTVLSPRLDQVAKTIARRFRWHIVPEGALAANMLGLSRQVPARITYLSDGPTRRVEIGGQVVLFKHARPKQMGTSTASSRLVIQALRFLGQDAVTDEMIELLRNRLSASQRKRLLRDTRLSSEWIYAVATRIAEEAE